MIIVIGCDHAGYELKQEIKERLWKQGYEIIDCGADGKESVDYPDFGAAVAEKVMEKQGIGIVICGTGIGISISANKKRGIRAALCHDATSARLAREHNNANILALGARITGSELALDIVDTFITSEFAGGRHQARIDKITRLENQERSL